MALFKCGNWLGKLVRLDGVIRLQAVLSASVKLLVKCRTRHLDCGVALHYFGVSCMIVEGHSATWERPASAKLQDSVGRTRGNQSGALHRRDMNHCLCMDISLEKP